MVRIRSNLRSYHREDSSAETRGRFWCLTLSKAYSQSYVSDTDDQAVPRRLSYDTYILLRLCLYIVVVDGRSAAASVSCRSWWPRLGSGVSRCGVGCSAGACRDRDGRRDAQLQDHCPRARGRGDRATHRGTPIRAQGPQDVPQRAGPADEHPRVSAGSTRRRGGWSPTTPTGGADRQTAGGQPGVGRARPGAGRAVRSRRRDVDSPAGHRPDRRLVLDLDGQPPGGARMWRRRRWRGEQLGTLVYPLTR
jgi:hypothetical protein